MARLHAVRAQDVCSHVLFNELLAAAPYRQWKDQVLQALLGCDFEDRVSATRRGAGRRRQRRWCNRDRLQRAFETIGHAMMAPRPLVRHERLDRRSQLGAVAAGAGTHDRDEEVCLCHGTCVVSQLARVATVGSGGRSVLLKHQTRAMPGALRPGADFRHLEDDAGVAEDQSSKGGGS